jgi:hypothetical protein
MGGIGASWFETAQAPPHHEEIKIILRFYLPFI